MNQVVNFLSALSVTEEQGGVKRMLGVCREFERIANVVLDKSEKSGRQKRKTSKAPDMSTISPPQTSEKSDLSITPQSQNAELRASLSHTLTPTMTNPQFDPNLPIFSSAQSDVDRLNGEATTISNGNHESQDAMNEPSRNPEGGGPVDAANYLVSDMSQFPTDNPTSPLNMGAFQQPFVPQDLWDMPMTLEWDWADMNMEFNAGQNYDRAPQSRTQDGPSDGLQNQEQCAEQTQDQQC